MNKLIYIVISLFIAISCNSGRKQNVESNSALVTEVQTEELVKAPESNIPNLKKIKK